METIVKTSKTMNAVMAFIDKKEGAHGYDVIVFERGHVIRKILIDELQLRLIHTHGIRSIL